MWIFGGFDNGIGETAWENQPARNDQSASAFRKAGIIMMYPSLRGGNSNPGFKEGFLGEVDDVLATVDYLASQNFVDPARIYLGGHSTGGTLVLLAAACSDRFRAVFSFGPAHDASAYGLDQVPFDVTNVKERQLRAPIEWLHSIKNQVFVFEGASEGGNIAALNLLSRTNRNPLLNCFPVAGADHFSILAPTTRLIAQKVVADTDATKPITFTQAELNRLFGR